MASPQLALSGYCFRLERTVNFDCDSFCWTDGPKTLTCKIQICTFHLDSDGFVFDNREIEEYIGKEFGGKVIKESCERIAERILGWLCSRLPNCRSIKVGVTGNPAVTLLSAEFENPTFDLGKEEEYVWQGEFD